MLAAWGVTGAHAQTVISNGPITGTTVWTPAGSPYVVQGAAIVYGSLTIQPGVTVQFQSAGAMMVEAGGALIASGVSGQPVTFTSAAQRPARGDWVGLSVANQGTLSLVRCNIGFAGYGGMAAVNMGMGNSEILGCTIHDCRYAAIRYAAPSVVSHYRNLTLQNNGTNGIDVAGGNITGSVAWPSTGYPYYVLGSLNVYGTQAAFTVAPGSTLYFARATSLKVLNGSLVAAGTSTQPITFDGAPKSSGAPAQAGSWSGISISQSPQVELYNCNVRHAGQYGYAAVSLANSQAVMANCYVHDNAADAVSVSECQPRITLSSFYNNGFGVRNLTPASVITAIYNQWGDPSGPTVASNPAGQGQAVTSGVVYHPWFHVAAPGQDLSVTSTPAWVGLTGHSVIRSNAVQEITVAYGNPGPLPIPAPLIRVVVPPGVQIAYPDGTPWQTGAIYLLGVGSEAPVSQLAPQTSYQTRLLVQAPSVPAGTSIGITAQILNTSGQPFPWQALEDAGSPQVSDPTSWSLAVDNLNWLIYSAFGDDSWDSVLAFLGGALDSAPLATNAPLTDFDNLLRYLVVAVEPQNYGTEPGAPTVDIELVGSTRYSDSSTLPGVYRLWRIGPVDSTAIASYVLIPGLYGLDRDSGDVPLPGDKFVRFAAALKSAFKTNGQKVQVYIADWTDRAVDAALTFLNSGWTTYYVGEVSSDTINLLASDGVSSANVRLVSMDLGTYIANRMAQTWRAQTGAQEPFLFSFDAANEVPLAALGADGNPVTDDLAANFALSVNLTSGDVFDTHASLATWNLSLTPPTGDDLYAQHRYALDTLMLGLLSKGNISWMDPVALAKKGLKRHTTAYAKDGSISAGGSYSTSDVSGALYSPLSASFVPFSASEAEVFAGTAGTTWPANQLVGAMGATHARYIGASQAQRYTILFENPGSASAPVQSVVISGSVDPAKSDIDSLQLGPIAFGEHQIVPPAGTANYDTRVDLRPDINAIVDIQFVLDNVTGQFVWTFTSLDPATGMPTTSPTAGFLPPNKQSPGGQGSVAFSVMPMAGLTTGAGVSAAAAVQLDTQTPIALPVWSNTLDGIPPTSSVTALPSTSPASFTVNWSGADIAGIYKYTIYVSDNYGPLIPWKVNTGATSAIFTGQSGHKYSFISTAIDSLGNVEDPPLSQFAVTTVN